MKVTVSSKRPWLMRIYAKCMECDWYSEDTDAQQEARKHAEKSGHWVNVETGYAQIYNYKGEQK